MVTCVMAKCFFQLFADRREQTVVELRIALRYVSRERRLGRAERPDVHMMHVGHARDARDFGAHFFRIDAGRCGIQREPQRLRKKTPGPDQDHDEHAKAHDRIDPQPIRKQDQNA